MFFLLFLAFQAMVFAAWVVVTVGILLGLVGRVISSDESMAGSVVPMGAWAGYMRDPTTAFRRRLWLLLFGLLILCAMGTFTVFSIL